MQYWIIPYGFSIIKDIAKNKNGKTKHIFLCIADHFEPGYAEAPLELQHQRVDLWIREFPKLAAKHRDCDNQPPKHTWFFPPHYDIDNHLEKMVNLCKLGLGEIELHFHHNRIPPFPDTPKSFEKKIKECLISYSRFNIFPQDASGKRNFAFIHGDWALDNSRGSKFCGINNELDILVNLGCYADFTFPALYESQPAMVNKIFYAKGKNNNAKSYDRGEEVFVGSLQKDRLMIIQGPLGLRLRGMKNFFLPAIECSDISNNNPPTPGRINFWIKTAIKIKDAGNFIFVKLHTHGAWEGCSQAWFGGSIDSMLKFLEAEYNDDIKFCLHYVTAREMFNVIKAVEAGLTEYLLSFRDFIIKPPVYY
jgi:hypothetical protein